MAKFASKLTDAQFKLAREFERANELTDNFLPGLAIHLLRVATRTNSPTTDASGATREKQNGQNADGSAAPCPSSPLSR